MTHTNHALHLNAFAGNWTIDQDGTLTIKGRDDRYRGVTFHQPYNTLDWEHAEYPGYYRKMQDKLAREQCKLSHMVKGSANWRKQCKRVARQGKRLVHVDKWYPSSQLCHDCGYKNPLVKDLSVREWACPSCGVLHDRDVNAARNIRDEAMRIIE